MLCVYDKRYVQQAMIMDRCFFRKYTLKKEKIRKQKSKKK